MPVATRLFLLLLLAGCIPFALTGLHDGFFRLGLVYDGGLLVALLFDLARLPSPSRLRMRRNLPLVLSLREPRDIAIRLAGDWGVAVRVEVKDCPPSSLQQVRQVCTAVVPPQGEAEVWYRIVPTVRGPAEWSIVAVRIVGHLGLVCRQANLLLPAATCVFPSLAVLSSVDLLVAQCGGGLSGTRRTVLGAPGVEFSSLRDYVVGDDYRHVSWKHTAHRHRLITKEFEPERSQQVLLLLDCGRTMGTDLDGVSRLDHAVNAAVALARVCLDAGDEVGLISFSAHVTRYVPPRGGPHQLSVLVHAMAGALSQPYETDYDEVFDVLLRRQRRRALVIMFTEVIDRQTSERLVVRLRRLVPRHVPVCVTLRDPYLSHCLHRPIDSADDVYEQRVASDLAEEREQALAVLRRRGGFVVDVTTPDLVLACIRAYLRLKRHGAW